VSLAVLWLSPSRIRRFAAGRAYRDAYELAGDTHRRPTPRRRRRDAGGGLRLRRHPGAVRRRPRGRGPRPRGGSRARETGRAAPDDRRPALRAQPRRAGRGERRRGSERESGSARPPGDDDELVLARIRGALAEIVPRAPGARGELKPPRAVLHGRPVEDPSLRERALADALAGPARLAGAHVTEG